MLGRIGFFHFGKHHDRPTEELRLAMDEAGDISDSLIVLPEAFNIRKSYRDQAPCNIERSVRSELKSFAKMFRVAFVVGLIVRELVGSKPPHSAAYLIDEHHSKLMCYKAGREDMEGTNYMAETPDRCDIRNPIHYRGVNVGALICLDANPYHRSDTYKQERARSDKLVNACEIICVPAHMADHFENGRLGSHLVEWANKTLVLANSNPYGIHSFITNTSGTIVEAVGRDENKIITRTLVRPEKTAQLS